MGRSYILSKAVEERRVLSELDLKRLFWKLSKKIHPDVASLGANHENFIQLKDDYEQSLQLLRDRKVLIPEKRLSRIQCLGLFVDLLAGNFPISTTIRDSNKMYLERVERLNSSLSFLNPDFGGMFLGFEKEFYSLRGTSEIIDHKFNVVKLYFYRFSDYYYTPNSMGKRYLNNSYDLVFEIFKEKNLQKSILFLNWIVCDILDKEIIRTV